MSSSTTGILLLITSFAIVFWTLFSLSELMKGFFCFTLELLILLVTIGERFT
jgi:hypothetical protein